jgi:signal peptidase I
MGELLKILRVYLFLGVLTVAGGLVYWLFAAYTWRSLPEDDVTMMPLLKPGQLFRIDKRLLSPERLRRGDVVAYQKEPADPDSLRLGRVVALPGERVAIADGQVRLNGEMMLDPTVSARTEGSLSEILVPRGTLFLLVDERAETRSDSRAFGPVSAARLLGKVLR